MQPPHGNDAHKTSTLHELAIKLVHTLVDRPRFKSSSTNAYPLDNTGKLSSIPIIDADEEHLVNGRVGNSEESDLILHLGKNDTQHTTVPHAKLGVWFIHRDNLQERIDSALLGRRPLLWLHLWQTPGRDDNSIERVGSHALPMQTFSISDITDYAFGALPTFIDSRINWLTHGHDPLDYEQRQLGTQGYPPYAFPKQYIESNATGLECLVRMLVLYALQFKQRLRDKFQHEQWHLGVLSTEKHAYQHHISNFHEIRPPENTIWADPHVIQKNGKTHVFFEDLNIKDSKGRISHGVLQDNAFIEPPQCVLEEPHHLSYPFVFEHQNDVFMVPETASNNAITLYKASPFPHKWLPVKNLIDNINAADTTLLFHNGLWWMFTNAMSLISIDERDQLMLFYAEDLLTDKWTAHPLNPVVTGVDRARMAGPVYQKDGALFRPSQFGATRYGFGINVAEISVLTTTDYQEQLVGRLSPDEYGTWIGCHTASRTGSATDSLIVIDRLRRRLKA